MPCSLNVSMSVTPTVSYEISIRCQPCIICNGMLDVQENFVSKNEELFFTGIDDDTENSFAQRRRQQIESTSAHIQYIINICSYNQQYIPLILGSLKGVYTIFIA